MSGGLDDLVTGAAAALMAASSATHVSISERVIADLVSHFGVDFGFLRHNDHTIHATVLVAEYPVRENVPDPDPIGVVYFAGADSIFAQAENLKLPDVVRPDAANEDYQRRVEEGSAIPQTSLACVPLLSGDVTTGTLGFVKIGDREWLPEELNALKAIASLFAQLQARIVAEDRVLYLAEHDDLTDLLNRRALIAHLDERLVAGARGPVSLLLLDIDRLKVINDHLGHHVGDSFLKAFVEQLKEAVDLPAVIARFGGDEFTVVPTAAMEIEAAEAFAKRLQAMLHKQVVIDGELLARTVSIGVAVGEPGRDRASDLLRRADEATSAAKSSGGSKVAPYNREMSQRYAVRDDIELHLEETIDGNTDALVVHYLPEFDLRTGEVLGAEALIRLQHPTQGLLMPDSFIGVAESINLAGKLGRLVMRLACAQFSQWRSRGVGLNAVLRVNVSPIQLVADGVVETVATTLDEFGLNSDALCLEITESVVVQDIDATQKTLTELKNLGVHIAVDDFGTGYSALTYLKFLPVDTLKVDKGFVRDLGTDSGDLAIVQSIMALADAFGLDVVAEGIESPDAAKILLDLGCHRAQGFLLSPPLDAAAMESLLTKGAVQLDFSNG
ncbi:EAL domain-containing protein [Mycobacterium cookii]|uniref:Bifunctional diguanylate cyclase/phosphodiesterase n=1 Tax=Mycobacterium cookii TaxID=1775 RepID=A0A7I7KWG6_9MYCO|nr:bifunctional diguanylate cyclase/phosphodiesterase [Mycobacterium cookii]MCV7332739.1 bifunctional diguanylate cyclase/phosphodiesterase [Mycobacterium cookii]BBX46106.1 bifunctional diguanylate cyclase/phosphodiesterase [Mycobacterium cookii]